MDAGLEAKTISDAIKLVGDYRFLFTDKFIEEALGSLSTRLHSASNKADKSAVLFEAEDWASAYSLAIYKLYPSNAGFRQTIDSNPELASNFNKMKEWLDARHGKAIAGDLIGG